MTYKELLLGYNNLNEKLLIRNFLSKNLENKSKSDVQQFIKAYALDYRFFNKNLNYTQNKAIKSKLLKKYNYEGTIIHGDILNNWIFKKEEIDKENNTKEFYPHGLLKKEGNKKYGYVFYDEFVEQTININGNKIVVFRKYEFDIDLKIAAFCNLNSDFCGQYCSLIDGNKIIFIKKIFKDDFKLNKSIDITIQGNEVEVL